MISRKTKKSLSQQVRAIILIVLSLLMVVALVPASSFAAEVVDTAEGQSGSLEQEQQETTLNQEVNEALSEENVVTQSRGQEYAEQEAIQVEEVLTASEIIQPFAGPDEVFVIVVTVTGGDPTFILPTSGRIWGNSNEKQYNWTIDWGDGSALESTGQVTQSSAGISHAYAAGGTYEITIANAASYADAWLAAFGFDDTQDGANNNANRAKLVGVLSSIKPLMTRSSAQFTSGAPTCEWQYAFKDCINLTVAPSFDAAAWSGVTAAGSEFLSEMFKGCTSLATLPSGFTLPQGITVVGSNFVKGMFAGCSGLTTIPAGFNFPQGIVDGQDAFAFELFADCKLLSSLPAGMTLPQSLNSVGMDFALRMFARCEVLEELPSTFNLPQSLETITSQSFAFEMFVECRALGALPSNFSFPQGLTSTNAYINFAFRMFADCDALTTLPALFNFPQSFTTCGDGFAYQMFVSCASLEIIPDAFTLPLAMTEAGNNFGYELFAECGNLVSVGSSFNLPQGIERARYNFAARMFVNCLSLTDAGAGLTMPQALTSVGGNFAWQMFAQCQSLAALPANFNLPPNVTVINDKDYNDEWGNNFAKEMFLNCKSLAALPPSFNFPQGLSHAKDEFAYRMFAECIALSDLGAVLTLPQGLAQVGPHFAREMFKNNESLENLPSTFNLPQNLSSTNGGCFAYEMFAECDKLALLPDGFNFPQNLTSVSGEFAYRMFVECKALEELPSGFNLPANLVTAENSFAGYMFYWCTGLKTIPESFNLPQDLTSVGENFAIGLFMDCVRLDGLPEDFTLPQKLTSAPAGFAESMFNWAGSKNFQINENFKFPPNLSTANIGDRAFYLTFRLSNDGSAGPAPLQNRTATSIINGCEIPSSYRWTFRVIELDGSNWSSRTSRYSDITSIHINWGGIELSSITANPDTLGSNGGSSEITINGNYLPGSLQIGAFVGDEAEPTVQTTATITGSGIDTFTQAVKSLSFEGNATADNIVYTIKVSFDTGRTWIDLPAPATPTTVTVYRQSILTVNLSISDGATYHADSSFLVEVTNTTTNQTTTKRLTLAADTSSASFRMYVPEGAYSVKVSTSGSSWRYTSFTTGTETIDPGEDGAVTIGATLSNKQWLSATANTLNKMQ